MRLILDHESVGCQVFFTKLSWPDTGAPSDPNEPRVADAQQAKFKVPVLAFPATICVAGFFPEQKAWEILG
jgi:hypothetical protein